MIDILEAEFIAVLFVILPIISVCYIIIYLIISLTKDYKAKLNRYEDY